jgi:hypothetical protein
VELVLRTSDFPSSHRVGAIDVDRDEAGTHRWLVLPMALLAWALLLAVAASL